MPSAMEWFSKLGPHYGVPMPPGDSHDTRAPEGAKTPAPRDYAACAARAERMTRPPRGGRVLSDYLSTEMVSCEIAAASTSSLVKG